MKLHELLEAHIDERHHSPATKKAYEVAVSLFQRDTGINEANSVTVEVVDKWKTQVLSRASGSTWNNYRRHLRTLFTNANRLGLLETENPFDHVKAVVRPVEREKICGLDEIDSAISEINNNPVKYYPSWFWVAAIKLTYYTGMRRRQLVGLRWRDINQEKKTLRLCSEHSKTKIQWDIPITPEIAKTLNLVKFKTRAKHGNIELDEQIFNITKFNQRYHGTEMSVEQLSGFVGRLRRRGFTITLHRLRHTMATEICNSETTNGEATVQLRTLQQQLGHTDISTTAKYIKPNLQAQAVMLGKLRSIG